MIFIKVFLNALEVKGHSYFDKKGKDIVCSAVSAVVQGFIKSFEDSEIKYLKINKNVPLIEFETKELFVKEALKIIKTQLKCIFNSSENYLELKFINKRKEEYYDKKK